MFCDDNYVTGVSVCLFVCVHMDNPPVTATTSPGLALDLMIPLTSVYLSSGEDRAKTRNVGQISSTCKECRGKQMNTIEPTTSSSLNQCL